MHKPVGTGIGGVMRQNHFPRFICLVKEKLGGYDHLPGNLEHYMAPPQPADAEITERSSWQIRHWKEKKNITIE